MYVHTYMITYKESVELDIWLCTKRIIKTGNATMLTTKKPGYLISNNLQYTTVYYYYVNDSIGRMVLMEVSPQSEDTPLLEPQLSCA